MCDNQNYILIVIVLYNENLYNTNTYKTLIKGTECNLYIYDNSPKAQHAATEFCDNWRYISDTSNSGLSYAYNRAAEYALENGYEWMLLTDQDTTFAPNIIDKYRKAINKYPDIKLFAPLVSVNDNNQFLSPSRANPLRASISNNIPTGKQSLFDYAPINSGMMINVNSFITIGGYNEMVKLDFADYQFISRFRQQYNTFYVINAICLQEFSNKVQEPQQKLHRFIKFCESLKYYQSITKLEALKIFLVVLRRTCSLSLETKTITPIKIFITKYIL